MAPDEHKLHEFLGRALVDLGGAVNAVLMSIGDELGLYKTLAKGPHSSAELARNTNTNERYIREWLNSQAAGGYVTYDKAAANTRSARSKSFVWRTQPVPSIYPARPCWCRIYSTCANARWRISGAARVWNGENITRACSAALSVFSAPVIVHIFFPLGFRHSMVWRPSLRRAEKAPTSVAVTAPVPFCSPAFPKSEFVGYDYHAPSIDTATQRAKDAGVVNAKFEVADATSYRGKDFDLIAFFDCLHDMADPAGAARHARAALKSNGTCMLVEPFAGDEVVDNLNPVGRMFYGASALVCVPVSLARNGPALGAQAGERRLREVMVDQGGFSTMRRASETPFNIILEARP